MPIVDQIKREWWRLHGEGQTPLRLRITHDAAQTLLKDLSEADQFALLRNNRDGYDRILGMDIERVPVGEIDDPCWQIMTTSGSGFDGKD